MYIHCVECVCVCVDASMAAIARQQNEGCGYLAGEGNNGGHCHTLQGTCIALLL